MKLCTFFAGFALMLSSCADTYDEPLGPQSAYNRRQTHESLIKAHREAEFRQDPYGWGAGRQPTQADMLFGGAIPPQMPRR